jgi:hypothetical protein
VSPATDFTITVYMPDADALSQCQQWISVSGSNVYFPGAGTWTYDTQPDSRTPVCTITMDSYGDTMTVNSQGPAPSLNGIATCTIYDKYRPGGVSVAWAPGVQHE